MSLSSTICRVDYVGNGSTSVYPYTFEIFAASDLVATVADTATPPNLTTLVLGTDYTIDNTIGNISGGNVTLVNAGQSWLTSGNLTNGYKLTLRRVRPLTQTTDIRNQGSYYPETIESTFDELVMICQQLQEAINRCVQAPVISTLVIPLELPEPVANDLIAWDPTGTFLETVARPTNGQGVPTGGTAGQVLAKTDSGNYDTAWVPPNGAWTTVTNSMSPYTASASGLRLAVDTSGGAVTINLPSAASNLGFDWTIMKITSDTNQVTINPNGSDTIQGDSSETLTQQFDSLKLSAIVSGKFAIV